MHLTLPSIKNEYYLNTSSNTHPVAISNNDSDHLRSLGGRISLGNRNVPKEMATNTSASPSNSVIISSFRF